MVLIEYSAEKNGVGGKLRCSKMCLVAWGPSTQCFCKEGCKSCKNPLYFRPRYYA
eukprot:07328.XXX_444989_445153_1 [CDS] Oithona nana genome sequencing.